MAAIRVAAWLCLLAIPVAAGQALDPQIEVSAVHEEVSVMWNGTATASWLVTNAGTLGVDIDLQIDDGGWDAVLDDSAFALGAGASRLVHVDLAPADPGIDGGQGPPLTLTVTATDELGRSDTSSATVRTQVTPRPTPAPIPPPVADTTVRDVSIAVAALVVPAVAAYVALGLLYTVRVPRDAVRVLGVHGAWVHVRVRNRAPWAQTVLLGLNRPAAGWQVAGNADRVTVPGRGEETYTVFVRRLGAVDDPARLRVSVRSRRSLLYPWRRHGTIKIDSEPIDLAAWSAKKIQAALDEAVVPVAAP